MGPDHPFRLQPRRAAVITLQLVGLQLAIGMVIGFVIGVAHAMTKLSAGLPVDNPPASGPWTIVVGNVFAFGFILWHELRRANAPWRALFRPAERLLPLLGPFLLCALGAVILTSEVDNLMRLVLPTPTWLSGFFQTLTDLNAYPISTPLMLVVVAPLTEELLFRALLLRGLLALTTPRRAILVSAVLFMAMHLNPWQFPTAFIIGILYGWIYFRTRSIALCIAGHAFNNACVLLVAGLPFTVRGFNSSAVERAVLQPGWFDAAGLIAVGLGVLLLHRRTPKPTVVEPPPLAEPPPLEPPPLSGASV